MFCTFYIYVKYDLFYLDQIKIHKRMQPVSQSKGYCLCVMFGMLTWFFFIVFTNYFQNGGERETFKPSGYPYRLRFKSTFLYFVRIVLKIGTCEKATLGNLDVSAWHGLYLAFNSM